MGQKCVLVPTITNILLRCTATSNSNIFIFLNLILTFNVGHLLLILLFVLWVIILNSYISFVLFCLVCCWHMILSLGFVITLFGCWPYAFNIIQHSLLELISWKIFSIMLMYQRPTSLLNFSQICFDFVRNTFNEPTGTKPVTNCKPQERKL